MVAVRLRSVDAFTEKPFSGNPAAVVVLDESPRDEWMAALAREMNLSETAFVIRERSSDADFRLRWFTPTVRSTFAAMPRSLPHIASSRTASADRSGLRPGAVFSSSNVGRMGRWRWTFPLQLPFRSIRLSTWWRRLARRWSGRERAQTAS